MLTAKGHFVAFSLRCRSVVFTEKGYLCVVIYSVHNETSQYTTHP
ncbi:hypothetical protein POREN0001_0301 [Porphyromonas endodontalis ATCC 35406]|uniref:Uncharacterized protein n=1 Tax=Porphyromonas endodontalis (strain ATCC 35406 / DSM 24491 / JCM 8526 / CCUG 16442 / BCRC 14492 / NCTC 13058 / HG 370) TaxID=553175 RepID=C3JAR3_POREA|nr:hypothetical protein POREN0001_0301 [Porphyromonas endodontalis ATCC 35406]